MTSKNLIITRNVLRAACAASLLAFSQAQAATTAQCVSSGLGTLLRYLLPGWF